MAEKLALLIERHGCRYKQEKRTETVCMYSMTYPAQPEHPVGYDVFEVRQREGREVFPHDGGYGKQAWSWQTRAMADACYDRLCRGEAGVERGHTSR